MVKARQFLVSGYKEIVTDIEALMKQTQAELAKTEAVQRVVEARAVAEEARQQKIVEDRENLKQVQEESAQKKAVKTEQEAAQQTKKQQESDRQDQQSAIDRKAGTT